jgi:cold shock CspA family protein
VSAFIESSSGNIQRASDLYERAHGMASGDLKAIAAYYFAGHLAKFARNAQAALPYAVEAHEALGMVDTAIRLGEIHKYLDQFEEARNLLEFALASSSGRARLIASSNLVDVGKREAEWLIETERRPFAAVQAGLAGMRVGTQALGEGYADRRLGEDLLGCAAEVATAILQVEDLTPLASELSTFLDTVAAMWPEWRHFGDALYLESRLRRLAALTTAEPELASRIATIFGQAEQSDEERFTGTVRTFEPRLHYGFLSREGKPDLFFHVNELVSPEDRLLMILGAKVTFGIGANDRGPCAIGVEVDPVGALSLAPNRSGVLTRVDTEYAFATDSLTGGRVYIRKAVASDWDRFRPGERVRYGVTLGPSGPRASYASIDSGISSALTGNDLPVAG